MASKDVIEQVSARAKQMSSGAKKGASQQVIDEVRARALKKTDIGNAVLRPNEGISTSAEAGEVPEGSTVRSSTGRIVSSQAPNLRTGNIGVEYSPQARQEQIRQRLEAKEAANQEKLKENLAKAASGQDGLPQDLKNPTEYMLERAKQERQQREEELRRTIEDLSGGSSIADFSRLKAAQEELQKLEQEDAKPEMEQLAELIGQQQRDAAKSRQAKSLDDNRQHNLEYLLASFAGGVSDWGNGVVQGIDALIPGDTTPANIQQFYHVKQGVEDTVENLGDTVSSGMQKYGGTIARGIGYSTPSAVLAMIPGVQSLSAAAGKGIEGMLKNPLYWASLIPTYGASYAEAKEDGATEEQAQLMAILNGFAGAAVEVGGGIEQIPTSKPVIRTWLKGMLEEGNEEVVQGIIEQLAKKITYDYDREWVSLTDPDAILNPNRAKDEFLGGAMVGGVLGGGQTMVNVMAQHAQYNRIGQELLQSENGLKNALMIGMANAEGTDARQAAEKIAGQLRSGKTPSAAMIGRLAVESSSEQALHAYRIHAKVMESADTTGASTEVAGAVAAVAVRFDRSVVFDAPESLQTVGEDGEAKQGAGYYDSRNDTIHVNAELTTDQAVDFVLKHELTHAIEGSETYTMLKQLVREQMGQEQFTAQVNETAEERRAAGDTVGAQSAEKEVIADWIGNNLFKDGFAARVTKNSRTLGEQFYRALWSVRRALAFTKNARQATRINKAEQAFVNVLQSDYHRGNSAVKAATGITYADDVDIDAENRQSATERQYSLRTGAKEDVERILAGENIREDIKLTESSPAIIADQKGARNLPMFMKASHIRENILTESEAKKQGLPTGKDINYHGLGEELFLQVIDGLNDVTVAYRGAKNADNPARRENYFMLVSQCKDRNGNIINIPVYINEKGQYNQVFIDVNKVATVYGKEDFYDYVQREIRKGNLVKIKRRGIQASERLAPIASGYSKNTSYDMSVLQKDTDVNTQSMQNGAKNAQNGQKSFLPDAIEQKEQAEKNENARRVENSAEQNGIEYSEAKSLSIKEQLRAHQDELNDMKPVSVQEVRYNFESFQKSVQWATQFFSEEQDTIFRSDIGDVVLGKKQIRKAITYMKSESELMAFAALEDVIRNGKIIQGIANHKQRGYSTITIAAPVEINGQRFNMAAVIRQEGKNYYKVHRILMPDGSVVDIKKSEATPKTAGVVKDDAHLSPDSATSDSRSIAQSTIESQDRFKKSRQKSYLPTDLQAKEEAAEAEKAENARRVANSAENEQDAENGQEDWEYSDEEMDRLVDEAAERRRTKLQEAQRAETERLTERLQAGEITAEEFGDEMERLRREAVEDNEKKWRRGNRGELQQKEQIRQERRAARADYVEKKAELEAEYADRKATDAEKRKAESEKKKKTEYRRQVSKIIDDLNSLLEHPDKNRHIPAENVQAVREVLETLAEDPEGIRQEINEIKRQMTQTADQRKIDRLAKQLNAREKRLENVSDQLRRVQDMYKDQAGEDDLAPTQNAFFGKKIAMLRESLDGRSLDKLSSGEMREVVDIMRSVVSQIRSANQLHSKAMRENAIDTAERFVREMDEASAYGKLGEKIRNMMLWQLSPDRFFESLCGWKANSVGKEIADSMVEAETKELSIRQAFSEHFYAYANGENSRNYDALSNTKELVDIGLQDSKGNAMKMTRGMMMSLYMNLLCEGNRRAIIDGGLILPDIKRYYNGDMANAYENGQRMTPMALSAEIHDVLEKIGDAKSDAERQNLNEELETLMVRANHDMEAVKDRIEEQMTDYERNLVKQAQKWFNEKSKSYINEATREVWDYEAARVKDYYPIYRDKNYVTTGMDSLVQNLTVENTGSLKARVRSKAPVHITDISQVLSASCDTTARFAGWLAFTTDFHKLYNTTLPGGRTSVKETLARKWGKGKTAFGVTADQYIQNFMADISGSRKADASPLSIFRKNAVRATLTLNLRVAVSQAASLPTAAAEIGYKYVAKAMKHLPEINAETMEKMRKYSVYFWQRSRGDGGMEEIALANSGSNVIDKAWDKVDKKTKGYLLNWCQKMDVLTVATCWFACEEMIKETRTDLKPRTDAFDRAVGQQLNTVIRKTQPNFTVAERSDLLRSKNEALKFLTMYKTQANQNMNILYEATGRYRATLQAFKAGTATQAELDAARRRLVNGYTGVIAGGTILFVLLRTLVNVLQHRMNGYRDKDGEITAASMAGAFGQEVLSSMAGMFAFGDIIYDALSARVFGGNYYGLSDTALETVGSLLEDFATGDLSKGKTWNYIMRDLMNAMGIPYKNVVDMVMGFSYHIEDIQNGEFLSMNAGYKTSDAMFYRRLYRYTKKGDTEKAAHLRQYLLTTGKTEEQIDAGMRTAIKGEDEDYRKQNDRMFKEVCSRALFSRLTDAEKKKVENGISGYVADALMAEKTGGTMKAEHIKAKAYVDRGVSAADYYLAQTVKNAEFADGDGDGKVSREEYRKVLTEAQYDQMIQTLLFGLK